MKTNPLFRFSIKTAAPALTLLLALPVAPAASAEEEMLMGSVAMDVPAEMVKRLVPLTNYLSGKIGKDLKFRAASTMSAAVEDLGARRTQIAYLTPVAYVDAHEKYGVVPLVNPLSHGKDGFNLVIVVQKNSPIKNVQDLTGKRFALGDEKALLQRAVVAGAGIKLEQLAAHAFLNHYDNIAKAVLYGDFDAGILTDNIAEKFAPQGLRIIYTSPRLPAYIFAVNSHVAPQMADKLKNAFLALKPDTPEGRAILGALDQSYTGFTAANDKDYDTVRKLVAPFKK